LEWKETIKVITIHLKITYQTSKNIMKRKTLMQQTTKLQGGGGKGDGASRHGVYF
jgi:hypothetical protein